MSLPDLLPTNSIYALSDFLLSHDSTYHAAGEAGNDADTTEYIELGDAVVFTARTGDFHGCVEAVDVDAQEALVRYFDTNTRAEMLQWLSVEWLTLAKAV